MSRTSLAFFATVFQLQGLVNEHASVAGCMDLAFVVWNESILAVEPTLQ